MTSRDIQLAIGQALGWLIAAGFVLAVIKGLVWLVRL